MWPLERIKPYPNNPRTHPPEEVSLLARMMLKFGIDQNIVVRKEDGFIIKGQGRRLAAIEAKMTHFPVFEKSVPSDDDARAQRIADNQIALLAGWDRELIRSEAAALKLAGYDVTLLGFDTPTLGWLTEGHLVADPTGEWGGMPHFNNPDATAFRSIVVHFKDQRSVDAFARVVKQKVSEKTRFMWYPEIEIKPFIKYAGGEADAAAVPDLHREQGPGEKPVHQQDARKDRRAVSDRGRGAGARGVRRGDRSRQGAGAG